MYRRYLTEIQLNEQTPRYDVIILGAGISGLYLASALPVSFKVLVMAKGALTQCNSQLAQGGVAMTLDGQDAQHVEDTMAAGAYENDLHVVKEMIGESKRIFQRMMALNVDFDLESSGKLCMTREGGHRQRRILHHEDTTGAALMRALMRDVLNKSNIEVVEHAFAIDIITDSDGIRGVSYFKDQLKTAAADVVVLATGGIGGWFRRTTNSSVDTGDGLAMAIRAGLKIRDAAYIQYHPTAFLEKKGSYFLISEAVRGEGGILINGRGERFMQFSHELMELAPRDVVSKAIDAQIQKGNKVYVDIRHLEPEFALRRFPNILKVCRENGLDPLMEPIPVEPVEHYHMGGIMANSRGRTETKGLYVTGEASGTGFHGANRLASNSLLECMALSERIASDVCLLEDRAHSDLSIMIAQSPIRVGGHSNLNREALQHLFDQALPLVKRRSDLSAVLKELRLICDAAERTSLESVEDFELYNGIMVGMVLIEDALSRSNSVGSFIIA